MLQADIVDREALLAARDQVGNITGGSLDYLINNAACLDRLANESGLDGFAQTPEVLEEALLKSFQVNVVGVIHTINAFLPLIKKSDIKKVALLSTGMADLDLVNGGVWSDGPYAISKAAANMVIFKYNALYKADGILFFAISPGVVATREDGNEPGAVNRLRAMFLSWTDPMTPLESAEACIKVTHDFSIEKGNGGAFVSHHGTKEWL